MQCSCCLEAEAGECLGEMQWCSDAPRQCFGAVLLGAGQTEWGPLRVQLHEADWLNEPQSDRGIGRFQLGKSAAHWADAVAPEVLAPEELKLDERVPNFKCTDVRIVDREGRLRSSILRPGKITAGLQNPKRQNGKLKA